MYFHSIFVTIFSSDSKLSGVTQGLDAAQITLPPSEKPVERATILVVDDTPDNLQLLAGLFEDEYRVKLANNGEKALQICQSDSPPDLLLLDIMMPGMDGFDVAKALRSHPSSSERIAFHVCSPMMLCRCDSACGL